MAKARSNQIRIPSARSDVQPATRKMLSLVRDELKSNIKSLEQKMDSGFSSLRAEFQKLDAGNSRMQLLIEEQNANNRIVLEGLQVLWHRQGRIEALQR